MQETHGEGALNYIMSVLILRRMGGQEYFLARRRAYYHMIRTRRHITNVPLGRL